MSLLFDALKKAEKDQKRMASDAGVSADSDQGPVESEKPADIERIASLELRLDELGQRNAALKNQLSELQSRRDDTANQPHGGSEKHHSSPGQPALDTGRRGKLLPALSIAAVVIGTAGGYFWADGRQGASSDAPIAVSMADTAQWQSRVAELDRENTALLKQVTALDSQLQQALSTTAARHETEQTAARLGRENRSLQEQVQSSREALNEARVKTQALEQRLTALTASAAAAPPTAASMEFAILKPEDHRWRIPLRLETRILSLAR